MNTFFPFHRSEHWQITRDTLHQATQVLNAIKVPSVARQPNALHHSLTVEAGQITTGALSFGGELIVGHHPQLALWYHPPQGDGFTIPLLGHNQKSLLAATLEQLALLGYAVTPRMDEMQHDTPFALDAEIANAYLGTLWQIYGALARVKARLIGFMTPLVLWSHHFDLASLYFLSGNDEHTDSHINLGFSPVSPGFPHPYFYAYRYPMPDGLLGKPLPAGARWHNDGWTGAVIDYDTFTTHPNPEDALEYTLRYVLYAMIAG
jgi:hypothetical protein